MALLQDENASLVLQISAASTAKASCLVNLGTVSQKEGNVMECLDWCDKALRYVKAHLAISDSRSQ